MAKRVGVLGVGLEGTHWVRALDCALDGARKHWPGDRDFAELRRHALKLRWWGQRHESANDPTIMDISYDPIKAMKGEDVYEARVSDEIGGQKNIRIVFFVPPAKLKPIEETPLPTIWILCALPKKRDDWTTAQIITFRAKRAKVIERFFE